MTTQTGLQRSLGLWSIVMLGLGYMTPAVVFDTFAMVSRDTGGHVPMAYILTLGAMLLTAVSYGRMVRVFPTSGSAYTYAQQAIHPYVGFMVGWLALLDYLLLPMVNLVLMRNYLAVFFSHVPPWIFVVSIAAILTWINVRGIKSSSVVGSFFVYFQFAVIVIFAFLAINMVAGASSESSYTDVFSLAPFYDGDMKMLPLISGATILCFSFLGFDAVTTYSEEAHRPYKTIPRAIFLTALLGGVIFIGCSYLTQLVFTDLSLFQDVENSSAPDIAAHVGGKSFEVVFLMAAFAGAFASAIASQASVARLLYVMGRDEVISKKHFARIDQRFHTPAFNLKLVGIVGTIACFISVEQATDFINFGALVAFTFVNVSVIMHYVWRLGKFRKAKDFILNLLVPGAGCATVVVLWLNIKANSFYVGMAWAAVGLAYLIYGILREKNFKGVGLPDASPTANPGQNPIIAFDGAAPKDILA